MNYLLSALIVLALAGEGWAWLSLDGCNECTGDPNGIHSCTTMACFAQEKDDGNVTLHFSTSTGCYAEFGTPPKTVEVECQKPQGLPVPVCLGKMEEAMKAMDESLNPRDGDSIAQAWLSRITKEQWNQWDAVKRECWREK